MSERPLGHTRRLPDTPFEEAYERTKDALSRQGFGILTEIDVRATLQTKLSVDFRPYVILGACHPPSAYRVLQAQPQAGLLLPCNVVVESDGAGGSVVSAIDARALFEVVDAPELEGVAADVDDRLRAALDALPA